MVYANFFIYFFNGWVGSPAKYILGDKTVYVLSFDWAKIFRSVPLQNCSAIGIFFLNRG